MAKTRWIRDRGGVIIHVHRPGLSGDARVSEAGIDQLPQDIVIGNVGSLSDYVALCHNVCAEVMAKPGGK